MTLTRVALRTLMREAVVQLLTDYADDVGVKLQVYPGRPVSIRPPTAFVDRFTEGFDFDGPVNLHRDLICEAVVLHGLFDSAEATAQADAFVDGWSSWVTDRYHAISGGTLLSPLRADDEPNYIPDWQPLEIQRSYYATRIALGGLATG